MTENDAEETRLVARKVLILEDNALVASHLERQLCAAGFLTIGPATTEAHARVLMEAERPDVAILDFNLGGGTTSSTFAHHLSEQRVPFLFLSGHLDRIEQHPSVRILRKPHRIGEILQALNDMFCKT